MHYCSYHKRDEPIEGFRTTKYGKLDSWCIEGRREYNRKYSEKKYAPIKTANAKRPAPTEKRCTVCKKTKALKDFPFRYDRPTKRESRCFECLKAARRSYAQTDAVRNFETRAAEKRHYHEAHPRYNDQSSRRRRARHKQIRTEPYTREQVRSRDKGLCWFCQKDVDSSLKWPHPESEVIHHIHPESKKGPDVFDNVAIAHNRCNTRHKNKHESEFTKGWAVTPISGQLARQLSKEYHYLHRAPNASFAFGLFHNDQIMGFVVFGSPSSVRITRSVCPSDIKSVIELNRLWCSDEAPFGAASWLVSRALKLLPPYIVISYADTSVLDSRDKRPHDGTIYRALSFNYAGQSTSKNEYRLPGSTRSVKKDTSGSEVYRVSPKNRFWTITGNRREKRALYAICDWPELPYG